MTVPNVNIEELKAQAKEFDYVRFTFSDINGIPRGKTVNGRHVNRFLENGLGLGNGVIAMGPNNEVPAIPEAIAAGFPNIAYKPVTQISALPWLSGTSRTGEVICEPFLERDKVQESNPRYVARKQLEKLASMGLKILSAYEMEFLLFDKDTLKPVFTGNDFINVYTYSKYELMFQEMEKHLAKMGVDVESFQCEYSPGQFEFTFDPKYGIDSADMMFKFREAMKEMCHQKGYHCTFMTKPFSTKGCSNGAHFNFSLWNDDGKNALYKPDNPDRLSKTGLHFIGGILKHIKALTAICSPTVNCYRRLHCPWAPDYMDWDIDNRNVTLRVKNQSENGTYFENRLPSGSSNPYLVLAATVAAGIDGLENEIEPQKKGYDVKSNEKLPHTLEEALKCLDGDTCIKEALGEEFTKWFMLGRTDVDVARFGKHDMQSTNVDEIEAERLEYFEFI